MVDGQTGNSNAGKKWGPPARAPIDHQPSTIGYAANELPQPQPPVEFGLLKVNPEPCIDET